jgi:hypothetical protein
MKYAIKMADFYFEMSLPALRRGGPFDFHNIKPLYQRTATAFGWPDNPYSSSTSASAPARWGVVLR